MILQQSNKFTTRLLNSFRTTKFDFKIEISYSKLFHGSQWLSHCRKFAQSKAINSFLPSVKQNLSETSSQDLPQYSQIEETDVEVADSIF